MLEFVFIALFFFLVAIIYFFYNKTEYKNDKYLFLNILRQLILLLTFHSLFICTTILFFSDNKLLIRGTPFFFFYGPIIYLFIKTYNSKEVGGSSVYSVDYKFFIGWFFLVGYIFLSSVSHLLSSNFIDNFIYIVYIFSGISILFFCIKSFSLVITSFNEEKVITKLNFFKLITFFFFLSILLLGFYFHDIQYVIYYRFVLLVYLILIISFSVRFYFSFVSTSALDNYLPNAISKAMTEDMAVINVIIEENNENIESTKYKKAKISDDLLVEYDKRIMDILMGSKLYLNADFKLEDLATQTKISRYYLGQYFSRVHSMNFNQYINKLRIEYVIEYIDMQKNISNLTVNELLAISAFNSRTSFFRSFKDFTGVAPSEYLDTIKKIN